MDLDDDLAVRLEREARASGQSLATVVTERLRAAFSTGQGAAACSPFRVEARALGLLPGLDYSDTGALLDGSEGPGHR